MDPWGFTTGSDRRVGPENLDLPAWVLVYTQRVHIHYHYGIRSNSSVYGPSWIVVMIREAYHSFQIRAMVT